MLSSNHGTLPKRKIGFNVRYLRDYNLRGFNRYTVSLLVELCKRDELEVVLFTDQRSPLHSAFSGQIKARVVEINSPRILLWEQVLLPRALKHHGIDLFHAPAEGGLPTWKSCPNVLTFHRALDKSLQHWVKLGELPGLVSDYCPQETGLQGAYHRYRHSLLRSLYLRSADRIIAVSQYGKSELVELLRVPEEKVEVIYEAADDMFSPNISPQDVQRTREKYGLPSRYLLFVGGFDTWKNVEGLLQVYSEAKKCNVREGLVLVGTGGDIDRVKTLSRRLSLQGPDVVFLERIHEDLPPIYRGATAFITLSWGESFCLPLVEAMRSGVPVIASNRGGIPEVLGGCGHLVDPRNPIEAVRAVREVSENTEFRENLRKAALNRGSFFSWKTAADQTCEVYARLLEHSQPMKESAW